MRTPTAYLEDEPVAADCRHEGGAFGSPWKRSLANAPWWAISLGVHGVAILLCAVIVLTAARDPQKPKVVVTELDDEPEEKYEPDVKRPLQPTPREQEPVEEVEQETEIVEPDVETPLESVVDAVSEAPESVSDLQFPTIGRSDLGLTGGGEIGGGPKGIGGPFKGRGNPLGPGTTNVPPGGPECFAALYWLKRHQAPDGGWKAAGFHQRCGNDTDFPGACANENGGEDTGWEQSDAGVSGLALLAFLGAGYTHMSGIFKNTVKGALKYALDVQSVDGSFGSQVDHQGNYSHAIMTMALVEAYGMTLFSRLKEPCQRAVDYIARARNDGLGWRYGVKPGDNDSSVTGWMALALKSAKLAPGLHVDPACFDGTLAWYDIATDPAYGRVGYISRGGSGSLLPDKSHYAVHESMTAVAMFTRLFLGADRANATLKLGADRLTQDLPTDALETKVDMYYWYYATLALYQMGGSYWEKWEKPIFDTLINSQRRGKACVDGSWDPIGAWGGAGGRVYATAINALTLEVVYRYEFIQGQR